MIFIKLQNVCVRFPIYGSHNMNFKKQVVQRLRRIDQKPEFINALENITLAAEEGDRIGVVGPNGSGKTTLLRLIAGALEPSSGTVETNGKIVSLLGGHLGLDPHFTGRENIIRRGIFLNQTTETMKKLTEEIGEFSGIKNRLDHPLYTYSSGMVSRLAFSIATAVNPEILVVDEGLGAADQEFTERAQARLAELLNRTSICVVASHDQRMLDTFQVGKLWELSTGHVEQTFLPQQRESR
jgi:ABC-type polysaccharide/polyol phosphate transport system ATPase subunit